MPKYDRVLTEEATPPNPGDARLRERAERLAVVEGRHD